MSPSQDASIIEVLQERQQQILSRLPGFAKKTVILASVGFGIYLISQVLFDKSTQDQLLQTSIRHVNLARIIASLLGLFSTLVIWLFVVWSMSFIPYIAYHAHRASRTSSALVATKPLRWLQLYAATFLPMALFAIAWSSLANTGETRNDTLAVESLSDVALLLFSTGAVVGMIFGINRLIPVRLAAIRLSFFSMLLYTSLFLAYGRGVTMASHAMVFGILLYLMFGAGELSELARRISLHDIDHKLAERFEQLIGRHDDVQKLRDETQLNRKEHAAQAAKHELKIEIAQSESDLTLAGQLSDMRTKKLELVKKMNQVQLRGVESRIDMFGQAFDILSEEMTARLTAELPQQISELKEKVKDLPPDKFQAKMNEVVSRINGSLQGIPESLAELRNQLLLTTRDMEEQTRLIAAESNGEERPVTARPSASSPRPPLKKPVQGRPANQNTNGVSDDVPLRGEILPED